MPLLKKVQSADRGRLEGVAAARYFPALFGKGFRRAQDNAANAMLNYGYAILRGCVARSLAVYGFLPHEGLAHHSELNPFNLTDDMMEPFRPAVDLFAAQRFAFEDELSQKSRQALVQLLACDMLSGGERHSLVNAIERAVQSLARCMASPGTEKLVLPKLLPLQTHRYE